MQIRDYEVKKYEQWTAETECNLPLLMKKPLLVMIITENQTQEELVFNSFYLITFMSYTVLCKMHIH